MSKAHTVLLWIRNVALVALVLVAGYVLIGRHRYYRAAEHERSAVGHSWITDGFTVAVVWPNQEDPSFGNGVTLAVEDVNARNSIVRNKIRLRAFNEPSALSHPEDVARQVAAYPDVIAVLGHERTYDAIPSSLTYEEHGILFLTPTATLPRLMHHGFKYLFRMTPDDEMTIDAICHFARDKGWKRIGMLYGRNAHGDSAADQVRTQAQQYGLQVVFSRSYQEIGNPDMEDYRPLVADIRRQPFDAIILADVLPWAAKMIRDMKAMGVTTPILGTDKLDSPELVTLAGAAAENVYVASAVDPSNPSPAYQEFRKHFAARFGVEPSYGATQGYESMTVLANACIKSGSADPIVVSTTLRTNEWTGLFGAFRFDVEGDVLNRQISLKRMTGGTFVTEAIIPSEKDQTVTLVGAHH